MSQARRSAPPLNPRRASRRTVNRRVLVAALLVAAGVLVAMESLSAPRTSGTGSAEPRGGAGPAGTVTAYLSASGSFARPAPERRPDVFAAAEARAVEAGSPLAFSVWTETPSFDAEAWRDLIQGGRAPDALPLAPPAVDFGREVAVLVWPAAGAPAAVRQAQGLVLRGAVLQQTAVELRVAPATEETARAPAVEDGDVLPYALVTVPRNAWPIPPSASPLRAPPSVPPLRVALAA